MITKTGFLDALSSRVLIGDGAMGTQLQSFDLDVDKDFLGLEGCNEILNDTRPDVLRKIHRAYFDAGADVVETNTFGCNLPNLADYGIEDRCRELALKGTALAREVADEYEEKFVLGSMGPGTKLPSLGHAHYEDLKRYYKEAALGMIEGVLKAFSLKLPRTCCRSKAAVLGCHEAFDEASDNPPHCLSRYC